MFRCQCRCSRATVVPVLHGLLLGVLSSVWALVVVITLWLTSSKQTTASKWLIGVSFSHLTDAFSVNWCYSDWCSSTPLYLIGSGSSPFATTACLTLLTPFLAPTIASWPFDGSLSDLNNIYPGSYTNPLTVPYVTGNIGQAMNFNGAQYVHSSTRFMNLSYQSWTIEGQDDLIWKRLLILLCLDGSCLMILVANAAFSVSVNHRISLTNVWGSA
jgi:hypothetical protein